MTAPVPNRAPVAHEPFTSADVIRLLERAGEIMLRLRVKGLRPDRCRSLWPEIVVDPREAYGWEAERIRWPVPTAAEIALMDAVAPWPMLVRDAARRRIVQSRSLVHPITGRHFHSWRRLARILSVHHETVRSWHAQAIDEIVTGLNR